MSIDLDAIEARAAAATPGPWEARDLSDAHYNSKNGKGWWWVWRAGCPNYAGVAEMDGKFIDDNGQPIPGALAMACITDGDDGEHERADATFIAHARTDIPDLVRELRETEHLLAIAVQEAVQARDEVIERLRQFNIAKDQRDRAEAERDELRAAQAGGASDCRSDEGVIVGLIDGMIASARVVSRWLRENVAPSEPVSEALKDIRTDEDIALVVRTMLAAADTAPSQAARRERDEAVREAKHQKRLLNEAWREVWRAVHDRNDAPEWWDLSPSDLICAVQDMHRPDDCPADALSARLQAVRDAAGSLLAALDEQQWFDYGDHTGTTWEDCAVVEASEDALRAALDASLDTPGDFS